MNAVSVCTISKKIPIFKDGIEAERIEVVRICDVDGNELQFNIIAGKNLYQVGDPVIYILPDYCLPDNNMFESYIRPDGDPKKSKLGKKLRIRAVKFNFQFENTSDPIYSNGIILPLEVLPTDLHTKVYSWQEVDLQKELSITKYVSEDSFDNMSSGLTKGDLPSFLYATDETRCEVMSEHINLVFSENEMLGVTQKRDGCLHADTIVDTEDGFMSIKYICDTKYSGGILSYNHDTARLEYINASAFMAKSDDKQWYEIEMEDGTVLKLTGNHKVWLPLLGCYRRADELTENDVFLLKNEI